MDEKTSDHEVVAEEEHEPQITSTDPNERKLARSLRIQRRLEAIKKQHMSELECKAEFQDEKTLLEKQIESSTDILEKLLLEGEEIVTNVRVGNDAREVQRRKKEELCKAELITKLDNEASLAKEMFDTIYEKWESIAKYKDPLDLHESIMMQKDQCDDLIKQKDDIIAMLKEEVNAAELKFSNDQEIQKDDISTVVNRIDRQVELMHQAYKNELNLIEETIAEERRILIETNNKKWEALHKQCSEQEKDNMDERIRQCDEYLEAFYKCRVDHEEEYRRMKINLESNTQVLEQELEHLKSLCLLNSEKLGYNYQILKRREEENIILKSQQKRLFNKLQDEINLTRKKIESYKESSEQKITKLSNDIKKLRNNILDVEAKSKHFSEINERKFNQVWALNLETVRGLIADIQTVDRVLYEQLLGLEWKKEQHKPLKISDLASYKSATQIINEQLEQNRADVAPCTPKPTSAELNDTVCKKILDKVSGRANLMVESSLFNIIKSFSGEHQELVRLDEMFSALNICSTGEMNLLMTYFFPYLHCAVCGQVNSSSFSKLDAGSRGQASGFLGAAPADRDRDSLRELPSIMSAVHQPLDDLTTLVRSELDVSSSQEEDEHSDTQNADNSSERSYPTITSRTKKPSFSVLHCKKEHPLVVPASCVFRVIREYLAQHNTNTERTRTISEKLARTYGTVSRLLSIEDMELFWDQFRALFSKDDQNLWDYLLFGLRRYHSVLEDRHKIYLETEKLRRQNLELRHLLKNCTPRSKKSSSKQSSVKTSQSDLTKDL